MPISNEQLKLIDRKKNISDRPAWDEYYLSIAYVVSQRSFDASSKCGCVLVSKDNRVLATGYNGPLKHSIDEEIPLTRPDKYPYMLHGEENALLAYNGSYQDIQEATAYITARPCHRCLRMLLQKGITRIIYGQNKTNVVNEEDLRVQNVMIDHQKKWWSPICKNRPYIQELNCDLVKTILEKTLDCIGDEPKHKER